MLSNYLQLHMFDQIYSLIQSILKMTSLPPTQEQQQQFPNRFVPMTHWLPIKSLLDVWRMIGLHHRLSQNQLSQLKQLGTTLHQHHMTTKQILHSIIQMNQLVDTKQVELATIEMFLYEQLGRVVNIQNECVQISHYKLPQFVQELRQQHQQPKNQENNTTIVSYQPPVDEPIESIDWVRSLLDVYDKYGGIYPVSSKDLFDWLKKHWNELEDYETHTISHVTDTILGGNSIQNIALNFTSWMNMNPDIKFKEPRLNNIV